MAGDDDLEVLDLGLADEARAPVGVVQTRRPGSDVPRRRVLGLAGLVAVAGGLAVVQGHRSPPSPGRHPAAASSAPPGTARNGPAGAGRPPVPPVQVTRTRPLLGGPRWDLFGLGDSSVVRVELATGRVTRTSLPPLADVELFLVPVRGAVLVHPGDDRPGYLVRDGQAAVQIPPRLHGPGPMLPGPDLDHVWVQDGSDEGARMLLVSADGARTRTSLAIPAYPTFEPTPDGAGYPLFGAVGGFYRGDPGGPRRITAGVVVASGPTGWLAVECDDRDACAAVLVDRRGHRRAVPGVGDPRVPAGVLAPDGGTAAVYVEGRPGTLRVDLLDLRTGRRFPTDLDVGDGQGITSFAWSPDSRWLFAVDVAARLMAVDARQGRARELVPGLPTVVQVALRA